MRWRPLHSGSTSLQLPHLFNFYFRVNNKTPPRSTARRVLFDISVEVSAHLSILVFKRPGNDLLFRALRRSTIGAGVFHGRVRNGIGCFTPAIITRSFKDNGFCETLVIFNFADAVVRTLQ
jgi:hypothetical protein